MMLLGFSPTLLLLHLPMHPMSLHWSRRIHSSQRPGFHQHPQHRLSTALLTTV